MASDEQRARNAAAFDEYCNGPEDERERLEGEIKWQESRLEGLDKTFQSAMIAAANVLQEKNHVMDKLDGLKARLSELPGEDT